MKHLHCAKGILFIVLVIFVLLAQFVWDAGSLLNPDTIQVWLSDAGIFAPLLYMLVMALAVVISPVPSLPLDIAAGAFFGPLAGTVYSVLGALAGAGASFMISRLIGREFIERFIAGHINFCTECSDKVLTKIVFLSRLLPVVSFDVISYGAGLTKMSFKKFCLATFFGMIPLTAVYNYFGSVLVFGRWLSLTLGVIMVFLFFMLPRWLEKRGFMSKMKHE